MAGPAVENTPHEANGMRCRKVAGPLKTWLIFRQITADFVKATVSPGSLRRAQP
jgi:hypothetical protein